jgi:D-arabinose 5-phosphate isomerase GutQ
MHNRHLQNQISNMVHMVDCIDDEKVERLIADCVVSITSGKKIIVSGLGKNVSVADKFSGTMLSLGLPAMFMHTNSALHGDLGMVSDGDVVILLSKSGNTAETLHLLQYLKVRDIKIWGMTFQKESSLAMDSHDCVVLQINEEELLWDIVPINSSLSYMCILQAIALSIAEKLGVTLADFKHNHPGGNIGERLWKK